MFFTLILLKLNIYFDNVRPNTSDGLLCDLTILQYSGKTNVITNSTWSVAQETGLHC